MGQVQGSQPLNFKYKYFTKMDDLQERLADNSILTTGMTFKQEFFLFCLERQIIFNDIDWEKSHHVSTNIVDYKRAWFKSWEEDLNPQYNILHLDKTLVKESYREMSISDMLLRLLLFGKCTYFKPYQLSKFQFFTDNLVSNEHFQKEYDNISLNVDSKYKSLKQIAKQLNLELLS